MSFLKQIDDYIRKEGIPFKSIEINYDYLPKYFDYAITCKLREICPDRFEMVGCEKYSLRYDGEGKLYLEAIANDKRTRLLIYDVDDLYGYYPREIGTKVTDLDIYRRACVHKLHSDIQNNIRNIIDNKFPSMSHSDKIKRQYEIMNEINLFNSDLLGNEVFNLVDLDDEMNISLNKIISYIDYLNKTYQEDLRAYNENNIIDIFYNEPESDIVVRKSPIPRGYTRERVNDVISMDDRINALNEYKYKYFGIAYSSSDKKTDYYCYLFYDYDNLPILVLEPYSGTKYTKVVYLDKDKEYTKEEFALQCKNYLELSNQEALNTEKVIRFNHTSIEEFSNNLSLVLDGEQKSKKNTAYKLVRINRIKNN